FPAMFNLSPRPEPIARADVGGSDVDALLENASPDFFETVGIPRLRGRDFTWNDDGAGAPVAILSAQLAEKLFPGEDAVGRTIRLSRATPRTSITVVGVVADAAVVNLRDRQPLVLYRPMLQDPIR